MNSISRFLPTRLRNAQSKGPMYTPINPYDDTVSAFKHDKLHVQYATPSKRDVLVIIPFFNPCNCVRIVQNLLFVVNKLAASSIPYVVAHCLFPDSTSLMSESSSYFTVKSSSYAFLKENLANIAIDRWRDTYSKFLVLDGDIIFDNKTWYDDLSAELERSDIVQPYTTYHHLDYKFSSVAYSGVSSFAVVEQMKKEMTKKDTLDVKGHPGFAIAFTLKYADEVGYPDETVIGGGDTLTSSIALKKQIYGEYNRKYFEYLYNKYDNPSNVIRTNALPGAVYHLYHNILLNRQYTTRYNILNNYINDETPYSTIDDLIYKNEDGVYEWKEEIREEINKTILDFFSSRQDDEVVMIRGI